MKRMKEVIMKLKHRKLILIISLSAMGIGLIAFSVANGKKNNSAKEALDQTAVVANASSAPEVTPEESQMPTATLEVTPEITQEPTETPTPTPEPNPLEECSDKAINKTIKSFLTAKLKGKKKTLKKLVTDSSYINMDDIQKKTEFIESYNKIKVYTKKAKGDVDYVAFVYFEMKIASINTKAPGLIMLNLKKDGDTYKIVLGDISDETASAISEINESDDVQDLIEKVNVKLTKAVKKDKDLADFCSRLDSSTED